MGRDIGKRVAVSYPGTPPELIWIEIDKLIIDHVYQRDLNMNHAQKILANFKWKFFQTITIAKNTENENEYFVIDGQHRVVAARAHPMIDMVPCIIVDVPTSREQAESFLAMNGRHKYVSPTAYYWAALAAGEPSYVKASELLDRLGIRLATEGEKATANKTKSISTIIRLIKVGRIDSLEKALYTIKEAWKDMDNAFIARIITAIERIYYEQPGLDEDLVAASLKNWTPVTLINDARTRAASKKGSERATTHIVEIVFNKMNKIRSNSNLSSKLATEARPRINII